jgi:Tol biopolymer transport system component
MQIRSGSLIGRYEILGPLGAGGMGEVYRGRDPRLDRDVAVKVLPASFARDSDHLRRFEQEARAAGALNHPGILSVFDVDSHEGAPYIVSELLEGETLRSRLAGAMLAPRRAIEYALQIAQALASAHEKGIVHRDLKPDNLFVTKDGRVKILDFGLAKLTHLAPDSGSESGPTMTRETDPGTVLGTVGYMAPEQVRGKATDPRSDIFALGTILYEMLTGTRAFKRDTSAETMTAILKEEPSEISSAHPGISPAIDRVLRHCLEKDPEARFQSARDLAFDLDTILAMSGSGPAMPATGFARWWLAAPTLLAVAAAAALIWVLLGRKPDRAQGSRRVVEVVRFTHEAGLFESPTWSPDGKFLAFASNRSGNFEVYVRRADGGQEVNVTADPAEDFQPAFSPDGRTIAFVSTRSSRTGVIPVGTPFGMEYRAFGGDLWIIPALGGKARRLAQDANYPTWRPDGRAILYVSGSEDRRSLREVSPEGASLREPLASADSSWEITRPHYSLDGLLITFETQDGKAFALSATGGKPHELLNSTGHAWADDGSLFFLRKGEAGGTVIGRVAVDRRTGLVVGSEEVVGVLIGTLRDLAIAPGSHTLAVDDLDASFNLARLPLSVDGRRPAGPEEALSSGLVHDRNPVYSIDGRRLAYSSDRAGPEEVWVLDLKTMHQERLAVPQDDLGTYFPHWLPDGNTLLAQRFRIGGSHSLWLLSLDGSRAEELPLSREIPYQADSVGTSPDGRRILVPLKEGLEIQLYELDLVTHRERRVTATPGNKYAPIWSQDGSQIAFLATTGGTLQLWTQPAGGGEARQLTFGAERMRHASFSPDGREIYVQPSHRNIWRVPTAGGPLEQVTTFPESGLFLEEPTLAPDGRALTYARWKGGASLWLLRLGSPEAAARRNP